MKRFAWLGLSSLSLLACAASQGEDSASETSGLSSSSTSVGISSSTAASATTGADESSTTGADKTSTTGADESSTTEAASEGTSASSEASESSSGDTRPTNCFSPAQALQRTQSADAVGCECEDDGKGVCVASASLVCTDGHWESVEDGPCGREGECHGRLSRLDDCLAYFDVCAELEGGRFCGYDPATDACPEGVIVDSETDCHADASCTMLPSGHYCTGDGSFTCPTPRVESEEPCDSDSIVCIMWAEGFYCRLPTLTTEECEDTGGEVIGDPGDGSVTLVGCPDDRSELGLVDLGAEGALCCEPSP